MRPALRELFVADVDAPARKVRPKSVGIHLKIPAFIRILAGRPVNSDGTRVWEAGNHGEVTSGALGFKGSTNRDDEDAGSCNGCPEIVRPWNPQQLGGEGTVSGMTCQAQMTPPDSFRVAPIWRSSSVRTAGNELSLGAW